MKGPGHVTRGWVTGLATLGAAGLVALFFANTSPNPIASEVEPLATESVTPAAEGGRPLFPPERDPEPAPAASSERAAASATAPDDPAPELDEAPGIEREVGEVDVGEALEAAEDDDPRLEAAPPTVAERARAEARSSPLSARPEGPPPDPSELATPSSGGRSRPPRTEPSAEEALPAEVVREAVERWRAPERCGLQVGEGPPGELKLAFEVTRAGRAAAPSSRQVDGPREARYADCLAEHIDGLRFPRLAEPVASSATFVF